MVSNKERCEVAARMRDIMRRHPNCFLDNMVAQSVLDVMGDGIVIGETVADLIEPQSIDGNTSDGYHTSTCRNIYAETEKVGGCENGFKCSECGNMVEDYEGYRISGEFNFCSKCGAVVVSDDD